MATAQKTRVVLDGESMTPELMTEISTGSCRLTISEDAWDRIRAARAIVDAVLARGETAYGISTGFGNFADVRIPEDKLGELQANLVRSHAAGVGPPLPIERARMVLALRINVFCKGHSGVRAETVQRLLEAFNASCISWIPEKGTVGASGDLAPLAHLALGLMGEGKMWEPETKEWCPAGEVLAKHGLQPIQLEAKEGLCLINGTQLITALGAEAVVRASLVTKEADVVAALSLEVLKGHTAPFNAQVHEARPHPGQKAAALRMRALMHDEAHDQDYYSEIGESSKDARQLRVQDSYSLRCQAQISGPSADIVRFVYGTIQIELNSANDNPMVFPSTGRIISSGNFHGEPVAKAMDILAIGIAEIASISERRMERLVNPMLSDLPAFLVKEGGLNSGYMIAHCTSAALVSENKVLCHPSSVDSISTSAAKEDHVSMGGFAARKCLQVVDHVETCVAIELLAACQGLEFLRPLKTTPALEAVHALVRKHVQPWDKDRYMAPDIEAAKQLIRSGQVWEVVAPFIERYHGATRGSKRALPDDVVLGNFDKRQR